MAEGVPVEKIWVDLALNSDTFKKQVKEEMDQAVNNLNRGGQGAGQVQQQFKNLGAQMASTAKEAIGLQQVLANTFQTVMGNLFLGGNPLNALLSGINAANAGLQGMAAGGSVAAGALAGILGPVALIGTGLAGVVTVGMGVINIFERIAASGEAPFAAIAARIQTLQTGLGVIAKNAGENIGFVNEKVQQLQATGITTRESIESLMQFMSQELPIDNIEKLARAGQDVAVAYGRNSTETFNRFVYAIMTGNNEVLRLVGINKSATQMQDEYMRSVGKTREQMTELDRRLAIEQGIIKAAEGYTGLYEKSMESLGKRIGSLPRYLEEAKLAFEQTLVPLLSVVVELTEKFWKSTQKLFVEMTKVVDETGKVKEVPLVSPEGNYRLTKFGETLYNIVDAIANGIKPAGDAFIDMMKRLGQGTDVAGKVLGPFVDLAKELVKVLIGIPIEGIIRSLWEMSNILRQLLGMDPQKAEDFWEAFRQAAIVALKVVVTDVTFLSLALDALDKRIHGQAAPSLEEIAKKSMDAGDAAVAAALGIETMSDKAAELARQAKITAQNLQELYTMATGKKAEGKEFEEWSKKMQQAYAAKYMTGYGYERGEVIGGKVKEGAPTLEQFVMGQIEVQKKKDEEDARLVAERTKFITDAIKKFADMMDQAGKAEEKAAENFKEAGEKFNQQVKEQENRIAEQLDKALGRLSKDYEKSKQKILEQAGEAEKEIEKEAGEARVEAQKDIEDRQLKMKQDFLFQMKRMEEDYLLELEDAVGARDAKRVLQLMRQYAINKQRANEDFQRRQSDQGEQDKKALDNINEREKKAKDRLKESLEKQLDDLKENLGERQQELKDNAQEQLNELHKNADKQRDEMKKAYDKQLVDLKKANRERMIEMVKGWADANIITRDQANLMLKNLDAYYGTNGAITNLLQDFIDRVKQNANLNIVITATTSGELTAEAAANQAGAATPGGGQIWYPGGGTAPAMAGGGMVIADRPMNVKMGEGGREAGFFMPMGAGTWSLAQLQNLAGGGKEDRIVLDMSLTATGISKQAEDQILSRIADAILTAVGQRIRITKR